MLGILRYGGNMVRIKSLVLRVFILITIVLVSFFYIAWEEGRQTEHRHIQSLIFEDVRSGLDILMVEEMKHDLKQLKRDLINTHPRTAKGLSKAMIDALEQADKKSNTPMSVRDFSILTAEVLSMLKDVNTYVDPYDIEARRLPLTVKMFDDTFYIAKGLSLEPYDKLVAIGGVGINELYSFLKTVIPADNQFWYNHMFEQEIVYDDILRLAGAIIKDNRVWVDVLRGNEHISVELTFGDVIFEPLVVVEEEASFKSYPYNAFGMPYKYKIYDTLNVCHVVFDEIDYTQDYKAFLSKLFEELETHQVHNLIIDLRHCNEGNDEGISHFFKYLNAEYYYAYGTQTRMARQSKYGVMFKSRDSFHVKNPEKIWLDKDEVHVFNGGLYVLIDAGTLGHGTQLATMLEDSRKALVVGRPTGSMPSGYGNPVMRQLEHSKIIYTISQTQYIRPDEKKRYDNALYPTWLIQYSLEDVIQGKDKALEALLTFFEEQSTR